MAITIPAAATIGAFSEDVAADAVEQGDYGSRIATAVRTLATEAAADIAVVAAAAAAAQATADEAGGGGTVTLCAHESYAFLGASSQNILGHSSALASQTLSGFGTGYHVFKVVFGAGWPAACNMTITGPGRYTAETDVLLSPGTGGGTVTGTKVFADIGAGITFTVTSPQAGGAAQIQFADLLCVANAPFALAPKVCVAGEPAAGTGAVDLTNGTVVLILDGASTYDVDYRYTATVS